MGALFGWGEGERVGSPVMAPRIRLNMIVLCRLVVVVAVR